MQKRVDTFCRVFFWLVMIACPIDTGVRVWTTWGHVDLIMVFLDMYFWIGMLTLGAIELHVDFVLKFTTDKYGRDIVRWIYGSVMVSIVTEVLIYMYRAFK